MGDTVMAELTDQEAWEVPELSDAEAWQAPVVEVTPEEPKWYDDIVDVDKGIRNFAENAKEGLSNVTAEDVGKHLNENKFAYTLGTIGALGGPLVSTALSGVGVGIDTALSDDENKSILQETAFSVGVDATMLAAFKIPPAVTRQIVNYLKTKKNPQALKEATEDVFKALTKDEAADVGTKTSAVQSQKIMEAAGGSLTLGQAGKKGLTEVLESFSFAGVLSGNVHKQNLNKIVAYTNERMNNLFNVDMGTLGAAELGDVIFNNLKRGREALIETHGKTLDQVGKEFGSNAVDVSILGSSISKWRKSKNLTGGADDTGKQISPSSLDNTTQNILDELENKWGSITTGSPQTLIDFTKDLNTQINSISNFGTATFSPQGVRELTALSNYMRGVANSRLKDINPKAAKKYREAQKYYAFNTTAMFPKINDEFLKTVDTDGLYKLGDMVTSMHKVENVKELYKSIDTAFKVSTRNNFLQDLAGEGKRRFPSGIKNPEDVKNLIRNRYLENYFPASKNLQGLDLQDFVKASERFTNSDEIALAKAVLGPEKFNSTKMIVNALATASKAPSSNFGSLAMRSKEITAMSVGPSIVGASLMGAGVAASTPAAVITGLTVLFTPYSLAHIVSNPKRVNQFLGLTNKKLSKAKFAKNASVLLNNIVTDLYRQGFSQEEVESNLGVPR